MNHNTFTCNITVCDPNNLKEVEIVVIALSKKDACGKFASVIKNMYRDGKLPDEWTKLVSINDMLHEIDEDDYLIPPGDDCEVPIFTSFKKYPYVTYECPHGYYSYYSRIE